MAKVEIDLGVVTNSCFVIMPFTSVFQTQYERIIKPAVEAADLDCIRADEIFSKPQITADIWAYLRSARIVIAELTGKNTNVFYELGIAHALGKPVIIVTRNEEDVPFDLKALRYVYYDINDPFWGRNLEKTLTEMLSKLLIDEEYGTVFQDIALRESTKITEQVIVNEPSHDMTGVWTGAHNLRSEEKLTLNLLQEGNNLSGTMIVSYHLYEQETVVEEIMTGEVLNSQMNLYGISYSFLEQGTETSYLLDTYKLNISIDGNELSGNVKDEEEQGVVYLIRQIVKEDYSSDLED